MHLYTDLLGTGGTASYTEVERHEGGVPRRFDGIILKQTKKN
jgi:hypothetical protein